jgi:hypothetical protein
MKKRPGVSLSAGQMMNDEINSQSSGRTVKLIGGGGFLGSMRTTLESTLGGGLKLFLPTCNKRINQPAPNPTIFHALQTGTSYMSPPTIEICSGNDNCNILANQIQDRRIMEHPHVTKTNLDQMGNGRE